MLRGVEGGVRTLVGPNGLNRYGDVRRERKIDGRQHAGISQVVPRRLLPRGTRWLEFINHESPRKMAARESFGEPPSRFSAAGLNLRRPASGTVAARRSLRSRTTRRIRIVRSAGRIWIIWPTRRRRRVRSSRRRRIVRPARRARVIWSAGAARTWIFGRRPFSIFRLARLCRAVARRMRFIRIIGRIRGTIWVVWRRVARLLRILHAGQVTSRRAGAR
jgi:hypothetical protein